MKISYSDPRYSFLQRAAKELYDRDISSIPTRLLIELNNLRIKAGGDHVDTLELIDGPHKECPNCNGMVEPNKEGWACLDCGTTQCDLEDMEYEGLPPKHPYDWPGMWGTAFWVQGNDKLIELAPSCGFLVWEPKDFDGKLLTIDGAGYDFFMDHWVPLYLALDYDWHTHMVGWKKALSEAKRLEKEKNQSK